MAIRNLGKARACPLGIAERYPPSLICSLAWIPACAAMTRLCVFLFSPDGRLYQVEYANEAVRRGTTSIGLKASDGIIIISLRGIERHSSLIEQESLNKIFLINDQVVSRRLDYSVISYF